MDAISIAQQQECGRASCVCHKTARTGKGPTHCFNRENHANGDRTPSMSLATGQSGAPIANCFVCSWEATNRSLQQILVDVKRPSDFVRERVTSYEIRDQSGELFGTHRRKDLGGGRKQVWWEPKGLSVASAPLYGEHEVTEFQGPGFLVEGEKARDALHSIGCRAVATVTGAGTIPSDAVLLRNASFIDVLWPDNDRPGHDHMKSNGVALVRVGATNLRVLDWPDAPPKGDAADFIALFSKSDGTIDVDAARLAVANLVAHAQAFESGAALPAQREQPSGGSGAETDQFHWRTAMEICTAHQEDLKPIVKWLIYPGGKSLLTGPPKAAGKTTFTLHMVQAILCGAPFCDLETTSPNAVVYITEEGPRSFRKALERAHLTDCEDLHVLHRYESLGASWAEICGAVLARALEVGAKLIVFDTFKAVAGFKNDDELSAGKNLEFLAPLSAITSNEIAVLLIDHDRKGGGEPTESARGSSALVGGVDLHANLTREQGGNTTPNIRKLHTEGRFEGEIFETLIELTGGGYRNRGTRRDVEVAETQTNLAEILPDNEAEAMSMEDLERETGGSRSTIQRALDCLRPQGLTTVVSQSRGRAHRFFLPRTDGQRNGLGDKYLLPIAE